MMLLLDENFNIIFILSFNLQLIISTLLIIILNLNMLLLHPIIPSLSFFKIYLLLIFINLFLIFNSNYPLLLLFYDSILIHLSIFQHSLSITVFFIIILHYYYWLIQLFIFIFQISLLYTSLSINKMFSIF